MTTPAATCRVLKPRHQFLELKNIAVIDRELSLARPDILEKFSDDLFDFSVNMISIEQTIRTLSKRELEAFDAAELRVERSINKLNAIVSKHVHEIEASLEKKALVELHHDRQHLTPTLVSINTRNAGLLMEALEKADYLLHICSLANSCGLLNGLAQRKIESKFRRGLKDVFKSGWGARTELREAITPPALIGPGARNQF
jgi:hypothetical protein